MRSTQLKQLVSGFSFGLVLQVAVGPISVYIFSLAGTSGFSGAFPAVLGVTLADAAFIFLAITGVTAFLNKERVKQIFKITGAVFIGIFGTLILLEAFDIQLIPSISLISTGSVSDAFMKGIIMTAANPLTIVFWGGVCTVRMTENNLRKAEMYRFGLGAALSTLICQTVVAVMGNGMKAILSPSVLTWMNVLVGIILIGIAIWPFIKREKVPVV
jgi:threonine/homoserine/homoserine lactone efflux protein